MSNQCNCKERNNGTYNIVGHHASRDSHNDCLKEAGCYVLLRNPIYIRSIQQRGPGKLFGNNRGFSCIWGISLVVSLPFIRDPSEVATDS